MHLTALLLLLAAAPVHPVVPAPTAFGDQGALAITSDFQASLGYLDLGGQSGFQMAVLPAADYFIAKQLSVGGELGIRMLSADGETSTNFSITPRVGFVIPLAPNVSVWPRLGFQLQFGNDLVLNIPVPNESQVAAGIAFTAPVLFHVSRHFFLGVGPRVLAMFAGDVKQTSATLDFTVGGWL